MGLELFYTVNISKVLALCNAQCLSVLGMQRLAGDNSFLVGFPVGSVGKESACSGGDLGSIPGLRRSPGEGNDNPLQYSCLENSMDRGAWQAGVHGVAKSRTRLSD